MLTGRAAFEGETASDVAAAVLRAEPDWSRLPGTTPPAMRRLLTRCLCKDPEHRLRDAGDAALDLAIPGEEPRVQGVAGAGRSWREPGASCSRPLGPARTSDAARRRPRRR